MNQSPVAGQKQVLAIHDLSCVGRCSLTVALPVLSACGVHTSALPTALLSTHTGVFTGYHCRDLTEDMQAIRSHFDTLPLHFDGLYSGFLGSYEQIALVGEVLKKYRKQSTLTLVDPVMADHGRLYATCTAEMARGMGELCRLADVIVPNVTEACLLLDKPYLPHPTWTEVQHLLEELASRFQCREVIITGVEKDGLLGAACLATEDGAFAYAGNEALPHVFYGTGDVFASALMGAMLHGASAADATRMAADFTYDAMVHTLQNGLPLHYGVAFEQAIPGLLKALQLV